MAGEFIPFGPDSMMWRINREQVVLLAGPAAAVLQVAHPQVAMGVAAHSKFRTDSIGRLNRTLEAVYFVAFGTSEEVERVRDGVARAHPRCFRAINHPPGATTPETKCRISLRRLRVHRHQKILSSFSHFPLP
jgi:uncharacterized protein (DUF2236 family)